MRISIGIAIILTLWLCAAGAVQAQPEQRDGAANLQPRGVSVGPAFIVGQPIYRGTGEADRLVVPFLGYESDRLYLRGLRAGLHAWESGRLAVDVFIQPRLDQLDPDDSDALSGMEFRRRTLEGGLSAGWRWNGWRLSGTVLTDLLDRHEGREAEIDLGYRVGPPFAFVRPSLSATWQSQALTDYYYGVRSAEARPHRPAYTAGEALNYSASIAGRYSFTRALGAFALVRHTWLDDAIADSPIVARDHRWSAILALTYTFR